MYVYLLHHGTPSVYFLFFWFASQIRMLHRSAGGMRSLGLMCRRLNGSADSPMQHDLFSSNLISKCARQPVIKVNIILLSAFACNLSTDGIYVCRLRCCKNPTGLCCAGFHFWWLHLRAAYFDCCTPVSKIRLRSASPQQSTRHNEQTSNCRYANLKLCKFRPPKS